MRVGTITMLASAIIALMAGWALQRNRMVNWGAMMRRIRWNRLFAVMLGKRFMRM